MTKRLRLAQQRAGAQAGAFDHVAGAEPFAVAGNANAVMRGCGQKPGTRRGQIGLQVRAMAGEGSVESHIGSGQCMQQPVHALQVAVVAGGIAQAVLETGIQPCVEP
ncbi:MAG: hypothetical protein DI635_08180 [Pseudoxanthomonas suwonensis]|nr:MAG: hypothetical protein DI635_08180 [Pseudoxanthomonas suwonensis]